MNKEAFVYCWTDIDTNRLYVGAHIGTPNDGYICSSKSMLTEYKVRPTSFVRQIIAQGSASDMFAFERVILKSVDARTDDRFYNLTNSDGHFGLLGPMSEEHKKKISKALKGNQNCLGTPCSSEKKEKISASLTGRKHTNEQKRKMSEAKRGSKWSAKRRAAHNKKYGKN